MSTTKLIYPDGTNIDIEGKWKATIIDISYPDCYKECFLKDNGNCPDDCLKEHPEDDDFFIDFFTFDEGCYVPMISFCGLIRPPKHIGKLLLVCYDED